MIRFTARFGFCSKPNPYSKVQQTLKVNGKEYKFFSLPALGDKRLGIFYLFIKINCLIQLEYFWNQQLEIVMNSMLDLKMLTIFLIGKTMQSNKLKFPSNQLE